MGVSAAQGSAGLKPGVCTSTTRPSNPFEGQMIYETDTDKVLVWNGSAWYANWNTAWGIVDTTSGGTSGRGFYNKTDANFTIPILASIAQITGFTMTFTPVVGRLYKATYVMRLEIATAQAIFTQFRIGATVYAGRADTTSGASGGDTVVNSYIFSGLTASTTLQVFAGAYTTSTGSLILANGTDVAATFCIEDIGAA